MKATNTSPLAVFALSASIALSIAAMSTTAQAAILPDAEKSAVGAVFGSMVQAHYHAFALQGNSLNARLGQLSNHAYIYSAWLRGAFSGGKGANAEIEAANAPYKDSAYALQAGLDQRVMIENNGYGLPLFIGLEVSYGKESGKGARYSGNLSGFGVGAYASYVTDFKARFDLGVRYQSFTHEAEIPSVELASPNTFAGFTSDKVSSNSFSLLVNTAYSFHILPSVYVEPHGGLSLHHIPGFSFSDREGLYEFSTDDTTLLLAHVGLGAGLFFDANGVKHEARLGVTYNQNISGVNYRLKAVSTQTQTGGNTGLVSGDQMSYELKGDKNVVATLGLNSVWSNAWRTYLELRSEFAGDYNQQYAMNAGVRYSFGSKSVLISKQPQQDNYIDSPFVPIESAPVEPQTPVDPVLPAPEPEFEPMPELSLEDVTKPAEPAYTEPEYAPPAPKKAEKIQSFEGATDGGGASAPATAPVAAAPAAAAAVAKSAPAKEGCPIQSGYYFQVAAYGELTPDANGMASFNSHAKRTILNTRLGGKDMRLYLIGPYASRNAMERDRASATRTAQIINESSSASPYVYYLSPKAAKTQNDRWCK